MNKYKYIRIKAQGPYVVGATNRPTDGSLVFNFRQVSCLEPLGHWSGTTFHSSIPCRRERERHQKRLLLGKNKLSFL